VNTSIQHNPTVECARVHCNFHHVDEPARSPYRVCFECGHVYPTSRDLRRIYRRKFWQMSRGMPWRRQLWRLRRVMTVRASQISFCQYCIHDFLL